VQCPGGPILASFSYGERATLESMRSGPAARVGARLGRALASLRGMEDAPAGDLSYRPYHGFAFAFTERSIDELARSAGRTVVWERGGAQQSNYAALVRGQ
jgi:hypothetical protein